MAFFVMRKSFFVPESFGIRWFVMSIWEVILIGIALSMDAFAVGMTNGLTEPKMKGKKVLLIAFFYGFFQFMMPMIGYYCSSVFADLVAKIAPWLSFVLLAFIGGKMVYDCVKEMIARKKGEEEKTEEKTLGIGKLAVQALATSIDALAVGVSLLATETTIGLPFSAWWCGGVIGCITFALSVCAVYIGKRMGDKLSDKAELIGGVILIAIGLKILIESFIG